MTVALLLGPAAPGIALADPPVGEPVILLHGFSSDPSMWRGAERVLRRAGFDPIAIPWRPVPGMRLPQVATAVVLPAIQEALLSRGHPPDVTWHGVGHSTGGLVLRWLVEHPWADVDTPLPGGFWLGEGTPDGDADLAARAASIVLLATPNHGARTGVASIACATWADRAWRGLACDLQPDAPALRYLGAAKPQGVAARYLAIGVETLPNLLPAPLFDGNGDGVAHSHDNSVMAESAWVAGAPFVIWRGRKQRSHFTVSCSDTVLEWITDFLRDGTVPRPPDGPPASADACAEPPN